MNDPEMRMVLQKSFLARYERSKVLILEEMGILSGESIVDLAVLSPIFLQAIEIKSAVDSLTRLPRQVELYTQVFDYISIATQPGHLEDILPLIPSFFGVILITDNHIIETYRAPTFNPLTKKRSQVKLLWKEEVYSVLRAKGVKGISKLNRNKLWKLLAEMVSPQELKQIIYDTLKARQNWKNCL